MGAKLGTDSQEHHWQKKNPQLIELAIRICRLKNHQNLFLDDGINVSQPLHPRMFWPFIITIAVPAAKQEWKFFPNLS
jgi:hypothetical protein